MNRCGAEVMFELACRNEAIPGFSIERRFEIRLNIDMTMP